MTGAVGATPKDQVSVSYDAQGDVTEVSLLRSKACTSPCAAEYFTYQWDELGRMSHAAREDKNGIVVSFSDIAYAYDGSGQRVLKAVTTEGTQLYTAEIFPRFGWTGPHGTPPRPSTKTT